MARCRKSSRLICEAKRAGLTSGWFETEVAGIVCCGSAGELRRQTIGLSYDDGTGPWLSVLRPADLLLATIARIVRAVYRLADTDANGHSDTDEDKRERNLHEQLLSLGELRPPVPHRAKASTALHVPPLLLLRRLLLDECLLGRPHLALLVVVDADLAAKWVLIVGHGEGCNMAALEIFLVHGEMGFAGLSAFDSLEGGWWVLVEGRVRWDGPVRVLGAHVVL